MPLDTPQVNENCTRGIFTFVYTSITSFFIYCKKYYYKQSNITVLS